MSDPPTRLACLLPVQVNLIKAGPFDKRGSYRVRVILYDGFQPVAAGVDSVVGASSTRIVLTSKGGGEGGG